MIVLHPLSSFVSFCFAGDVLTAIQIIDRNPRNICITPLEAIRAIAECSVDIIYSVNKDRVVAEMLRAFCIEEAARRDQISNTTAQGGTPQQESNNPPAPPRTRTGCCELL